MKIATSLAIYFAKVTAIAFATTLILTIIVGMAFSAYSRATNARVSAGAFDLQGEDFLWITIVAITIGGAAVVERLVRRRSP